MSYHMFRSIAGIDSLIDRNEFAAFNQMMNPYNDYFTNMLQSNIQFSLMDRNGDGRIDFWEFADAQRRLNPGFYPGQYSVYGPRFYGYY
ncbi:hypothetical protein BpHYR1_049314 [Brachionus plicatilis]|uniref:EF-hand domain-containing protein n=1 Tax=Brachionus plicatilis TaxID=10195 RepID=A0A3M7SFN5_BRAPC|nr:hypothetical protein BpHYR1_049314 [Brachionus plicatilis]